MVRPCLALSFHSLTCEPEWLQQKSAASVNEFSKQEQHQGIGEHQNNPQPPRYPKTRRNKVRDKNKNGQIVIPGFV
eukprot:5523722-Amphidinium_carterae.1